MFRLSERQWKQIEIQLEFKSKGSQGDVFKGKLFNHEVAVKKFKNEEDFVKEVICINNCSCEYVVSIFGITSTPEAILLDWYPYDLENYIIDIRPSNEDSIKLLFQCMFPALTFYHHVTYDMNEVLYL